MVVGILFNSRLLNKVFLEVGAKYDRVNFLKLIDFFRFIFDFDGDSRFFFKTCNNG